MNLFHKSFCLGLILLFVLSQTASAAGIHLCVDDQGNKTFQQHPCKKKETEKMIQPVTASQLDHDVIVEAVARLDQAMTSRDVESVLRLLTSGFSYQQKNLATGEVYSDMDRQMFRARMSRLLPALTVYRSERLDPDVVINQGIGRYRSRLREYLKFMDREGEGDSVTEIQLQLVSGVVKISRMITYQNSPE